PGVGTDAAAGGPANDRTDTSAEVAEQEEADANADARNEGDGELSANAEAHADANANAGSEAAGKTKAEVEYKDGAVGESDAVDEAGAEPGAGPEVEIEAGSDGPGSTAQNAAEDKPSRAHPGVRRALAEAHAYVDTPPPPGRVRSSFATGDARMLRADGPGWSLVARTDDIAFILLDEEPGEVLPVGRGTELPGLLKALDAIAVRPA
ncbi:hypothetical protein ACFU8Q_28780, partial [Streptomyces sp. NPDC057543]